MKESLKSLITKVQIEDVRLLSVTAATRVHAPIDLAAMTLNLGKSASVRERREDGTFLVEATIDAQLASDAANSDPAVSVQATFELQYKLPIDFSVSEADLSLFAEVNAVYNAWPYWREFIQSTVSRMNLPPMVLPVFRVGEVLKQASDSEATPVETQD